MRILGWVVVGLAGCGKDEEPAGDGEADTDTDTDTDTDADTDADTDLPPEPVVLECASGPCDGDPSGVWNLLGQCIDDPRFAEFEESCAGIEVTAYAAGSDGTVTFDTTDYVFYAVGGVTGLEVVVPPECNTGCLNYQLPDLGVDCVTTGPGGCQCGGSVASEPWVDAGTWTRSGSTLTLTSSSTFGSRDIEVCVTGDSIWLYDPNRAVATTGIRPQQP